MTRTRVVVGSALVGLAVLTASLAYASLTQLAAARIVGYQRTGDDRKIVVIVATGLLVDLAEREVKEDARSVRVTVRVRPHGSVPAIAIALPVVVTLGDRLADRQVLDQDGAPVRDLGVYQPPIPSPRP